MLEEKIKIANTKYEKAQDELTEEISRNKESLQKMEDELELNDGITNKSSLFITVISAKDLIADNLITDCNPNVALTFQDDVQETKVKNNTISPEWYENFKFKINAPYGALRIEVFDNTLLGKKSIGFLSIDLTDLMDQKRRLQWYDLYNTNHTNCGKIYLKINCIINFKNFYEGEIENAEKEMVIIQNAFNLTNYYVDTMAKPFGLLFVDNLENLLDNQQLKQADELINILEKNKEEDIYEKKNRDYSEANDIFKSVSSTGKKLKMNFFAKIWMFGLIICTFVSLLERSDFINLIIAILTLRYFLFDKSGKIIKFLGYFTWLLWAAILLDVVWLLIKFKSFVWGKLRDPEIWIKRVIYIVSACGTAIKFLFLNSLRRLKKQGLLDGYQS